MSEWETEELILRSMGNGQYEDYRIVSADEAERRVLDLEAQLAENERLVRQHDLMYELLLEFADPARFDRTVARRAEAVLQAIADTQGNT